MINLLIVLLNLFTKKGKKMLNNQDFAQFRAKSLGGSDVAAILGLSPYRSAVDVWMEKTGKPIEMKDSLPLRFGSFAEEFVASEYSRHTGYSLINHPYAITHPSYPYFGGHIDRFVTKASITPSSDIAKLEYARGQLTAIDGAVIEKLLECKTANPFMQQQWGDAGTDQVPLPYLCQCLWYMAITQVNQTDLAVLFGNADFRIYHIARDLQLEQMLLEKADYFWNQYVLKDAPPPAQSEADYQSLFTKTTLAKSVEASSELVKSIGHISKVQQRIDQGEEELSKIKQQVMATLQDAEILTYQGKTLATWKAPKPSVRLDAKQLEKDHPALVAQYQNASQSTRRLLIKPVLSQEAT